MSTEKCNYVMIDVHIESSVIGGGLLTYVMLLPGNKSHNRAVTPIVTALNANFVIFHLVWNTNLICVKIV